MISIFNRQTANMRVLNRLVSIFFIPLLTAATAFPQENTYYQAATEAARQRHFSQTISLLEQAIERMPSFFPAYVRLSEMYRYLGQSERGKSFFDGGIEAYPDNPYYYAGKAELLAALNDWSGVFSNGKIALKLGATEPEILQRVVGGAIQIKKTNELQKILGDLKKQKSQAHLKPLGYAIWQINAHNYKSAKTSLQKYLKSYPGDAFAHEFLGDVFVLGKNFKVAKIQYFAALRNLGKNHLRQRIVLDRKMAETFQKLSVPDSAKTYYGRAVRLAKDTGHLYLLLQIYKSAIGFYRENDFLKEVEETALSGIDVLKIIEPGSSRFAQWYFDLAAAYERLEDYERALLFYNKSLTACTQESQSMLLSKVNLGIGRVYCESDKPDEAQPYLEQSVHLARQGRDQQTEASALILLSDIYAEHGDEPAAKKALNIVLRYSQRVQNHTLTDRCFIKLAYLYMDNPEKQQRRNYYLRMANYLALQTFQLQFRANHSWIHGQIALNENDVEKAETHFLQAVQLGKETGSYLALVVGEGGLIRTYLKANIPDLASARADTALMYLKEYYPLYYEENVSEYFDIKKDVIVPAIMAYSTVGSLDKIYAAIELYKSIQHLNTIRPIQYQLLQPSVADSVVKKFARNKNQIKQKWNELWQLWQQDAHDHLEVVLKIKSDIKRLHVNRIEAINRLLLTEPKLISLVSPRPPELRNLQVFLKQENRTYIDYLVEDTATFILVVTPESIFCKRLNVSKPFLRNLVFQLSPLFVDPQIENPDRVSTIYRLDTAYQLYQLLFYPIKEWLPGNNHIIISGDDVLSRLPFAALVSDTDHLADNYDYPHANFLVKKYLFSYIPNAQLLLLKSTGGKEKSPLLWACVSGPNAVSASTEYSSHPQEFDFLKEYLDLPDTKFVLPADTLKSVFLNEGVGSEMLHIASSAFSQDDAPLYTKILFSKTDSSNGVLQAVDFFNLTMPSRLFVLSALSRKFTQNSDRPGYEGLLHGLIFSGTTALITNLWNMKDGDTGQLFVDFYSHISNGMIESEALQKAKVDFLQNVNPNPYFWAAYTFNGPSLAIPIQIEDRRSVILLTFAAVGVLIFLIVTQVRKMRQEGHAANSSTSSTHNDA